MNNSNNLKALVIAIQANVPILLWGPPGVGKSATVTAIAKALDLPIEIVIASIREPSDFAGLPVIRESGVHMEPPAWAVHLTKAGKGILFLDEISTAPPAVQAALLRVVLDRVVGDLRLPAEVVVIAAANPPEIAAGGWDLSAPLANRFCHLSWQADPHVWVEGMIKGWPSPTVQRIPPEWEAGIPMAKALIASFINHRPHLLQQIPKDENQIGKAWPSPRSWEMSARLLAAATAAGAGEEVIASLIVGSVGEGAAMEFLSWRRNLDLPDPEDLLKDPSKFTLPTRGDKVFAVLTAVVSAALGNLTKERWNAAWQVLACAAEQGAKDVAAAAAKSLASARSRRPDLPLPHKEIKEFIPLLEKGGLL